MRVGITTLGCDAGKSGIGKYAIALLRELPVQFPNDTFVIAVLEGEQDIFVHQAPNVEVSVIPKEKARVLPSLLWHALNLPSWTRQHQIEVLFLPAGNRRLPFWSPCPTVGTVHDLSSFSVEAKYDRVRMFYIKKVLPRLIKRLTVPLTVSEHSKRDIVKYVGIPADRIPVVYNGFESRSFRPIPTKPPEKYWLYVSRIEHPGKNHARLLEAYELMSQREVNLPQLWFAGGDWDGAPGVHELHEKSPVRDSVRFLGYVKDGELPKLVAGADLVIYPSLYEGFGIPLLEAMACDVPVISSNTSSLPEVGGDAAVYFDPKNAEDIANTVLQVYHDSATRTRLISKGRTRVTGFTWQKCAAETMAILKQASDNQ